MIFAAFVAGSGIPTLRHDWAWPIDRAAVPAFLSAAVDGWLSAGLGTPNPHPTTYLVAPPIAAAMWLFGPLAALALLAIVIGYACMRCVAAASSYWKTGLPGTIGIGLFALFNPWVYNEVVAGHLVMVLAYAGLIGLFAEMLHGRNASVVRLALWIALIEAQLQFFILAMLALAVFASTTRKWLPLVFGVVIALPSAIGLIAERGTLLRIPYVVTWQANQSVQPLPLLALGGYFPGYADRLGIVANVAVWAMLALAAVGVVAAWRHEAVMWAFVVSVIVYIIALGVHGPLAVPYAWIVRNVPESGVFRELYDLTGALAAFFALLACVAAARFRPLGYGALAAGGALAVSWAVAPPSNLWVASRTYPHPAISAPAFTRVALMPAFQPLGLRSGEGDGADPDAYDRFSHVPILNEYFPTYPVDMALARYEQSGDVDGLRALGVSEVVSRPWLLSRTHGAVGLAARSLKPRLAHQSNAAVRYLDRPTPLIALCGLPRVVTFGNELGACDLFFGDLPGYAPIRAIAASSDSIDPQTSWIDARLAFAEVPTLAQGLGGALTQSSEPLPIESNVWLLTYVHGALIGSGGELLARNAGGFAWVRVPEGVSSVHCVGLCELVAQTRSVPTLPVDRAPTDSRPLRFRAIAAWLYIADSDAQASGELLRFNERYDPGWIAFEAGRILRHVRVDTAVNGWFVDAAGPVVLVQATSVFQLIAEIVGACCVLWLLKALAWAPTKRAVDARSLR
jgi:hypothetical protein